MLALDLKLDFPILPPPLSDVLPYPANKPELETSSLTETFLFSSLDIKESLTSFTMIIIHGIKKILIRIRQ